MILALMTACLTNTLSIDIETYSSANLSKVGVYKYVESPDFEILLFAYSLNGEEVKVVDIASGEHIPTAILRMIEDDSVIKFAYNASFERIALSRYFGYPTGKYFNPKSWRCTMIHAATLGLPLSLKDVGAILNIDKQKLSEGKDLIRYFCVPCKPTKTNGHRTRNYYYHDRTKWERFKEYNRVDVLAEMEIQKRLIKYPVSDQIWREYHHSETINDRGVMVDIEMVENAIKIDEESKQQLMLAMQGLTDLENPNSVSQMKTWLQKYGIETDDLGKKNVQKLKESTDDEVVCDALSLRQQLAKSSVKKYEAMKNYMCSDNRIRGMFGFYQTKTGRFSGRGVQLQNLPQNHLEDLKEARELVKTGNTEAIKLLYEDVPNTLSQLIRTAFIPKINHRFIVADFAAIEARVLAWLANEKWRLEAFKKGEDIYCASASKMFNVPVEKHGQNAHLRQKGKVAELGLGYGSGKNGLILMGALEMGLLEEELDSLVKMWRESSPMITKLWWSVDKAVKDAITFKTVEHTHGLRFECKSGMLFIKLPSGRSLAYVRPKIETNKFGSESVTYEGVGQNKHWERIESYGPKFVENIVQAIARDILCFAMLNLKQHDIVMHIHDEVVIESSEDVTLDEICSIMSLTPPWADERLILRADGYETEFYKKD